MKLLVCISRTPETTARISFTNDNSEFDTYGIKYEINPYDEWYALVRALELKEAQGGSVTAINVGPATNDKEIRKALAIGADDAVRINSEPKSAYFVARQIAEYAKAENFDVVFLGKETIDYNGSEVGAMLAELLDMPFISHAQHLSMDGHTATVVRDIEGGAEEIELDTPFVISASKGLAEQRIPNMRGIMQAKRKPLKAIEAIDVEDLAVTTSFELPPAKSAIKLVDPEDMDELVRLLHEEAKVI